MGMYWQTKIAKGDATEKAHTGWIKLDSIGFNSGRTVRSRTGRVADRQADVGQVGELTLTKLMDSSSMALFKSVCQGHGEALQIDVTRAGPDKSEVVYLTYKLENALLTSYAYHTEGANPSETLTINFTKITMTYTPQDAAAKGSGGITVSMDQETGTAEGA
jgi:type VI secretion system secreted protein Hcp